MASEEIHKLDVALEKPLKSKPCAQWATVTPGTQHGHTRFYQQGGTAVPTSDVRIYGFWA